MTRIEIIKEIIDQYVKHPENRSVGINGCLYDNGDNKICAFAYVVKPESRHKLVEGAGCRRLFAGGHISIEDIQEKYIPKDTAEYQDLYSLLQAIHDISYYPNNAIECINNSIWRLQLDEIEELTNYLNQLS